MNKRRLVNEKSEIISWTEHMHTLCGLIIPAACGVLVFRTHTHTVLPHRNATNKGPMQAILKRSSAQSVAAANASRVVY